MKKSKFLIIIILIFLVGIALIYYFYQMFTITKPVIDSTVNLQHKIDNMTTGHEFEELTEKIRKNESDTIKEITTYRQSFRDPFQDYNAPEKQKQIVEKKEVKKITSDDVKQMLPFTISGIIGNDKNRLAIINTDTGSRIIKKGEIIKDFKIEDILENSLLISYKSITLELELGSGSGVN